jgi:Predicted ATPase (AAA+ superfamily)
MVKESFADSDGDDVHIQDTMQELTSLLTRIDLQIMFSRPDKNLYSGIAVELAKKYGINMPEDKFIMKAEAHAPRAAGRSPRTARQFIEYFAYKQDAE